MWAVEFGSCSTACGYSLRRTTTACDIRCKLWCAISRQVLAYMTWRDFGWRLHSRLGVDFRKKGAEARRRLYSFQDIYVTLIKLDLM